MQNARRRSKSPRRNSFRKRKNSRFSDVPPVGAMFPYVPPVSATLMNDIANAKIHVWSVQNGYYIPDNSYEDPREKKNKYTVVNLYHAASNLLTALFLSYFSKMVSLGLLALVTLLNVYGRVCCMDAIVVSAVAYVLVCIWNHKLVSPLVFLTDNAQALWTRVNAMTNEECARCLTMACWWSLLAFLHHMLSGYTFNPVFPEYFSDGRNGIVRATSVAPAYTNNLLNNIFTFLFPMHLSSLWGQTRTCMSFALYLGLLLAGVNFMFPSWFEAVSVVSTAGALPYSHLDQAWDILVPFVGAVKCNALTAWLL